MAEILGHYKILGQIGAGRMGELFRARDTRAGRTVALRLVAAEIGADPDRRRRFLDDARAAAALSHPSIAALYEVGLEGDQIVLVSEFVPGETLRAIVAGHALNLRSALDHAVQLADALAEIHGRGLLHDDIDPRNVIVTPKGTAKFIDAGLAAWTRSGSERREIARAAGDNAGAFEAVAYMAPEEVLAGTVDHRTDLFALGAVLFEMFAGAPPPLVAATAEARTADVLSAPPPPPSAINPAVPAEIDAVVLKLLERAPDRRHAGAAAVAAELRAAAARLDAREAAAPPPAKAARPARRGRISPWIVLACAAVLIGLVLYLVR